MLTVLQMTVKADDKSYRDYTKAQNKTKFYVFPCLARFRFQPMFGGTNSVPFQVFLERLTFLFTAHPRRSRSRTGDTRRRRRESSYWEIKCRRRRLQRCIFHQHSRDRNSEPTERRHFFRRFSADWFRMPQGCTDARTIVGVT